MEPTTNMVQRAEEWLEREGFNADSARGVLTAALERYELAPFELTENEQSSREHYRGCSPVHPATALLAALDRAQRVLVAPTAGGATAEQRTIAQLKAAGVDLIVAQRLRGEEVVATYVVEKLVLDGCELVPFALNTVEQAALNELKQGLAGEAKFSVPAMRVVVDSLERAQRVLAQPSLSLTDAQVREIADAVGLGVGEPRWHLRTAIEKVLGVQGADLEDQLSAQMDRQTEADMQLMDLHNRTMVQLGKVQAEFDAAEATLTAIADELGYVNHHEGAYQRIDNERLLVELKKALKECPVHGEHGGEAEELRKGVEALYEQYVKMRDTTDSDEQAPVFDRVVDDLRTLLDDVDARDSLAYLERKDRNSKPDNVEVSDAQCVAVRSAAFDDMEQHHGDHRLTRAALQQFVAPLHERVKELEAELRDRTEAHANACDQLSGYGESKARVADLESTVRSMRDLCDERTAQVARVEHEKIALEKLTKQQVANFSALMDECDELRHQLAQRTDLAAVTREDAYESRLLAEAAEFSINDANSDPTHAWRILASLYRLLNARRTESVGDALKTQMNRLSGELEATRKRLEEAEDVLRDLASYAGNGGYNAPDPIDLKQFEAKIRDGLDHADRRAVAPQAFALTAGEHSALEATRGYDALFHQLRTATVQSLVNALDRALAAAPAPELPSMLATSDAVSSAYNDGYQDARLHIAQGKLAVPENEYSPATPAPEQPAAPRGEWTEADYDASAEAVADLADPDGEGPSFGEMARAALDAVKHRLKPSGIDWEHLAKMAQKQLALRNARIAELEAQVKQDDDWVAKSGKVLVAQLSESERGALDVMEDEEMHAHVLSIAAHFPHPAAPVAKVVTIEQVIAEMRESCDPALFVYADRIAAALKGKSNG